MKIALCSPTFPPEFLGGTERVVLATARALRDRGDEVLVVSGSDRPREDADVDRYELDGLVVIRIPRSPDESYGLDLRRPRLQAVYRDVLAEVEPDVVHVHHWALLTTRLLRTAREFGIARVATLHDMWTTCPRFFRRPPAGIECPTGSQRDACVACARQGLPHLDEPAARDGIRARDADLLDELAAAQRLTAPSGACRDRIREHLPWDSPIEVVPHGLLEPVPAGERAEPHRGDVVRIGTFGNLVEEKGVMLLVWACREIPNLELHLSGPFLDARFAALVRDKAQEFGVRLIEHGRYGPGDRHPALGLDVAVFPSLCEETYGLVVEESLARGVPVVVSDRGALAERIGGGGIAIGVDELGPLERTMRELCREPARIEALRQRIPTTFATVADATARYRQLYEEAMSEVIA